MVMASTWPVSAAARSASRSQHGPPLQKAEATDTTGSAISSRILGPKGGVKNGHGDLFTIVYLSLPPVNWSATLGCGR